MAEKITVLTRRKNIQLILDYCMDNKIEIKITPREMIADEFETELTISGIKQALALGIFVKEHKFEVFGLGELAKNKTSGNDVKKAEGKENGNHAEGLNIKKEQTATVLNF